MNSPVDTCQSMGHAYRPLPDYRPPLLLIKNQQTPSKAGRSLRFEELHVRYFLFAYHDWHTA